MGQIRVGVIGIWRVRWRRHLGAQRLPWATHNEENLARRRERTTWVRGGAVFWLRCRGRGWASKRSCSQFKIYFKITSMFLFSNLDAILCFFFGSFLFFPYLTLSHHLPVAPMYPCGVQVQSKDVGGAIGRNSMGPSCTVQCECPQERGMHLFFFC